MRWNWIVKVKLIIVLTGTLLVFGGLAFWAIPLRDPRGPFVLLNIGQPLLAVLLLGGLAALVATAAEVWLGEDMPNAGWLAIGAGWLSLSLRSHPLSQRLMFVSNDELAVFYVRLLAELVGLFAISAAAWWLGKLVSGVVGRLRVADPEMVVLSSPDKPGEVAANFLGTTIVALVLYMLLIDNFVLRGVILHGQVIFALLVGFLLAALLSHQFFRTRAVWGLVLAVCALGVGAYAFAAMGVGQGSRRFMLQAPMTLAEPTPVDLLGCGLVGAMTGYLISLRLIQSRLDGQADEQMEPERR